MQRYEIQHYFNPETMINFGERDISFRDYVEALAEHHHGTEVI
jgi:hypothetical protein